MPTIDEFRGLRYIIHSGSEHLPPQCMYVIQAKTKNQNFALLRWTLKKYESFYGFGLV